MLGARRHGVGLLHLPEVSTRCAPSIRPHPAAPTACPCCSLPAPLTACPLIAQSTRLPHATRSWIPLYLGSLGVQGAAATGLMAGLPWLTAGLVGAVAGSAADGLITRGTPRLAVRRLMHGLSTLGAAACAVPLAAGWASSGAQATAWLMAFQGCYACSFGGFHAYVQDVGGASSGKLLGLTNSCSIALGIAGNLCTGALVQSTGSYSVIFVVRAWRAPARCCGACRGQQRQPRLHTPPCAGHCAAVPDQHAGLHGSAQGHAHGPAHVMRCLHHLNTSTIITAISHHHQALRQHK